MGTRSYYGAVGNGETLALIAPDMRVAWLCVPRFDGVPLWAGALDPVRGGGLSMGLEVDGQAVALSPAGQSYRGRTGLLTTHAAGGGWELSTTDFMPRGGGGLVRWLRVRGAAAGRVRVTLAAVPVASALWPVASGTADGGVWQAVASAAVFLAADRPLGPWSGLTGRSGPSGTVAAPVRAAVDLGLAGPGAELTVVIRIGYGPGREAAAAAAAGLAEATPEQEEAWWEQWLASAHPLPAQLPARWAEAYWRSLVMLKLLTCERTGAFLAAGTASLPAEPGGEANWDYRYCWLRDGYLSALALDTAGLHADARQFYDFAFGRQEPDGHWRQPLYTVDGGDPVELNAPDLTGPGGERPVRLGNAAAGQLQLDNEGCILHGLWFHYRCTGDRSVLERHWNGVRRAAEWTAANWERPESGIWELRDYTGHWVWGKALCHTALAVAARIAGALGREAEAADWTARAAPVRAQVVEQGWDPERRTYVRHYGEATPRAPVDISALGLSFYGLLPPDDPRLAATVAVMEQEADAGGLMRHGGVCRWERAPLPFYLPTLWLARQYLLMGRTADCDRLLEVSLDAATDLLLMAEHFDPAAGTQWGNFPQAFSHLEVVRLVRERAQGWSFCAWEQAAQGTGPRG